MNRSYKPLLLAALLSLPFFPAACGNGSPSADSADEESSPTRTAYLQQANGICSTLSDELEALAEEEFGDPTKPPSEAARRRYLDQAQTLTERRFTELRELERPPGDVQQLDQIYDALDRSNRELARQPVGAPGGEPPEAVLRFQRLAREYGLDACAGT